MRKAREQSWNCANLIWSLGESQNKEAINKIDHIVLKLSQCITSPKSGIIRFIIKFIQKFETKKVSTNISKLKAD